MELGAGVVELVEVVRRPVLWISEARRHAIAESFRDHGIVSSALVQFIDRRGQWDAERLAKLLGEPLPDQPTGRLVVGSDRLRLVVDDQALLDDLNPYTPDGGRAAVDALQGRCVVVIARDGDVDFAHHDAAQQLAALMGTDGPYSPPSPWSPSSRMIRTGD